MERNEIVDLKVLLLSALLIGEFKFFLELKSVISDLELNRLCRYQRTIRELEITVQAPKIVDRACN